MTARTTSFPRSVMGGRRAIVGCRRSGLRLLVACLQEGRRGSHRLTGALGVLALVLVLAPALPAGAADQDVPMAPVEASEEPLVSWPTRIGAVRYVPGRGLQVGDTGLTLGGYTNVALYRDEGEPPRASLQDLSLFVIYEPLPRLRFFSELEYADAIDDQGEEDTRGDSATVERLYLDVGVSDALTVRGGIFLTPVGRWNVIHAAPLVWTTSRPLTTYRLFDTNVTGLMASGSIFPAAGTLTYSVFDQFAGPIEGNPDFEPADHSVGARLQYDADGGWSVGASYVAALRDGDWRHLGGLDALWSRRPLEVMGEAVLQAGPGGAPEWGFYVQPVLSVHERVALVARYEHFDASGPPPQVNIMTAGVLLRLLPTVVFKTEYQFVDRHTAIAPAGFRASIAVLF